MTTTCPRHGLVALFTVLALSARPVAAQTPAPSPPTAPPSAGESFSPTMKVYGFVQTHYRYAFETGADGVVDAPDFRVQRVRIGVKGAVTKWLSYEVEIDPRAPDVTGVLRDAFLAFAVIPRHELRVGQQKTQFGLENRESSSDLFVVNRSEVSDNLSRGVNLRDIGVGLIGNIKLAKGWRLEDAVTVVNGNGLNTQADSTRRKNVWGRAGLRYRNDASDLTLRTGVSAATGDGLAAGLDPLDPSDDYLETFSRLGVDAQIDHRLFQATAEYVRGTNVNTVTGQGDDISGYYATVVGKSRWRVGPLVRLDAMADEFRRWTIGGYYGLPKAPLRLLLNYEYRAVKDSVRGDDKLYLWAQVRF